MYIYIYIGFPGSSIVMNPTANVRGTRNMSSFPGSGRSPREGNGNPLEKGMAGQYSSLGNPMDRGAQQGTMHGVAKSQT